MQHEADYANLEEAWDSYPSSEEDSCGAFEVTFYGGALAVLSLLGNGRSEKTLRMEVNDWLTCFLARMCNERAN